LIDLSLAAAAVDAIDLLLLSTNLTLAAVVVDVIDLLLLSTNLTLAAVVAAAAAAAVDLSFCC
jgi:hypothetical protein